MKPLLTVMILLMSAFMRAQFACSGLDRVDIYLNGKLSATATGALTAAVTLKPVSKADTLMFHAFTNWEGLHNSTLDVKDETGELLDHINCPDNSGYEAVYTYIFDRSALDDPDLKSIDIFINLMCERDIEPEDICTITLAAR